MNGRKNGENKIIYLNNKNKLIFISSENIPTLVNLFQEKQRKENERKYSSTGNVIFKSIVGCVGTFLGISLYYGTSKIDNSFLSKFLPVISGLITLTGSLAVFFIPEIINKKVDNFIKSVSGNAVAFDDNFNINSINNFKYQFSESINVGCCKIFKHENNYNGLVSVLESISPDTINRSKHNKFIKNKSIWIDDCYDPCFTDDNEGIILHSSQNECYGHEKEIKIHIYKQGNNDNKKSYAVENCLLLSSLDINHDVMKNTINEITFSKEITNFDESLVKEIITLE